MVLSRYHIKYVALFTRAWIEMFSFVNFTSSEAVALFTRAWIEMPYDICCWGCGRVALFTRAWIEMYCVLLTVHSQ